MYQITNLNLIPGSVLPVVNVSQYDKGRQFQLLVSEGEYAYDLTGKTVTIRGTKPDMHGFDYGTADGVLTVAGNVVNVFTTQQMTAVAGQVMAELRIASGSTILGTINFIINVEESALSDDTIISETEIPVIERDFETALAEAEADALVAEGYAKGTQDGTPATSGQPYYHDNAKYYKEQAEAAGSGTSANALKAEGYAVGTQNGVPVTSESPYYHNNAAYYDGTAQTSATNAGNSETAAAGSASAAAADALEAEGFAVGEQNGVPVSSGSPYYQNNAKYYSGLSNPTALANMSDVDISSPSNNQVLKYNSVSQKWENGTGGGGASALDDLTDVDITSPASGDGLLYDGAKWVNGAVATPTQLAAKLDVTAQQQLGAWNLGENRGTTQTLNGATFTKNADDTVTVDIAGDAVTAYAEYLFVPEGTLLPDRLERGKTYYLSGCTGGGFNPNTFYVFIVFRDSDNHSAGSVVCTDGYTPFTVPLNAYSYRWGIAIFQAAGKLTGKVFSPMISLQSGMPYAPWVMTNRELTEVIYSTSVAGVSGLYSIKCGNVVTLILENTSSTSVKSATLPTALRSRKAMSFTAIARNGTYYYLCNFAINTNGTMAIYYSPGAGQARAEVPDGWQILGSCTYVVYQ